jgi:phospholipase C
MKTKHNGVSRRTILKGAGAVAAGGITVGCGDVQYDGGDDDFRDAMCEGGADLDPDQLLAPVENIVVLMMENRSFDHQFGSLSLLEGREDVDGLKGGESNPGANNEKVEIFHLDQFRKLHHLPHNWDPMHSAFNGGKMDGFVKAHHEANKAETLEAGPEVMGFLTRDDLPISYTLADNYTLCDRYFCSVMGPTWPNRFYLHAASSGGRKTNHPKFFMKNIWGALKDKDVRGVNYFSDLPWAAAALGKFTGFSRMSSFFEDAEKGKLPPFSILDPGFFSSTSDHPKEFGGDSDHPEMGPNTNLAQLLIATIYKALANSPQWNKTMFIITYDESGGFYDHVAPPSVMDERSEFQQLGFRVPTLVIGPHVRSGCINNNLFEHASVIATATTKWGLEPLNARVDSSLDLSSCIHPDFIGKPNAPIDLPQIEIDEGRLIEKLELLDTQPELRLAADSGDMPRELDLRSEFRQSVRELVRKGTEYGIVHPVKQFKAF